MTSKIKDFWSIVLAILCEYKLHFHVIGGGSVKRMDNYTEHKEYQMETANPESPSFIKKISAGPILSDDGSFSTSISSLFGRQIYDRKCIFG